MKTFGWRSLDKQGAFCFVVLYFLLKCVKTSSRTIYRNMDRRNLIIGRWYFKMGRVQQSLNPAHLQIDLFCFKPVWISNCVRAHSVHILNWFIISWMQMPLRDRDRILLLDGRKAFSNFSSSSSAVWLGFFPPLQTNTLQYSQMSNVSCIGHWLYCH